MKIDPESWPRLSRLLEEWLDLPEESRADWLKSLGPEYAEFEPAFRRMALAHASTAGGGFLDTLPNFSSSPDSTTASSQPFRIAQGVLVGPYRLLSELGQGGMSVVWLAERADSELKRPVALKLPIIALRNPSLIERFARERDILAQLTHPNIARLYDAGVADPGQPYLALEYVEGERITAYCDQRSLALKSRLRLFLQVLRVVQHAHTHLIVHRDLKPANILVTNDGDVRLLDFGIAKLLTEGEAKETELTLLGGRALTPDYASPEQIAGDTITTASDIYSLGVILYELLTGDRPYKLKRDTRASLEEAILVFNPVRPSQTVKDVAKAQARSTAPSKLSRALKGDLDSIALKALSKEPQNRYLTADAFAQDIENYLHGEPVLAQPESSWYRTVKFVRRNKLAVGAATAVVAALSIGLGIALWQAHIAQIQTRTAEAVQAFLLDIFRANSNQQADPVKARQTTARELLDLGAKKVDGALKDAPEAKLSVLETLFRLYSDLGLQDQGVALGRSRVALAKTVYGPTHPEVARALVELASDSGESSFANDRPALLKEAGSILDRHGDSKSRTRALYYLAMGNASLYTDLASSATFAARSIELYRQYPPSRELVSALNLLGQRQDMHEQYPEAIASFSEAARIANSVQGEARRPLPAIYAVLGEAQRKVLDLGGAEQSLRLALQVARALKGEDSVDVLQTKWRLGNFLVQTSRPREGLILLKDAADLAVRTQGEREAFHTPMVRRAYGINLLRYGRVEDGLLPLAAAVEVTREVKRAETHDFATTLESDAAGETALGHYRQAEAMIAEASGIRARLGGTPAWDLNDALLARAKLLVATGKVDEAETTLQQSSVKPDATGKITYDWLNISLARAEVNLAQDRPDAAIEQARLIRSRIEASGLGPYFKRWEAQAALEEGKGLLMTGHVSEALPVLQRSVELGSEIYDPTRSPALADSQIALAACLLKLGRSDQARVLFTQAKAIHATHKDLGEQFRKPLRDLGALQANRK